MSNAGSWRKGVEMVQDQHGSWDQNARTDGRTLLESNGTAVALVENPVRIEIERNRKGGRVTPGAKMNKMEIERKTMMINERQRTKMIKAWSMFGDNRRNVFECL